MDDQSSLRASRHARRRRAASIPLGIVASVLLVVPGALASTRSTQWQQIREFEAHTDDGQMGYATAISGNATVAAASVAGVFPQQVRVFHQVQGVWVPPIVLHDPHPEAHNDFGSQLAMSANGRTLVTSAPGQSNAVGVAYVYHQADGQWRLARTLTEPGAPAQSSYGASVAISSDATTILVGAPNDSSSTGAAFEYHVVAGSWTLVHTFRPTGQTDPGLGTAVALSATGTTAVIGAAYAHESRGEVLVFHVHDGRWGAPAVLVSSQPSSAEYFGLRVAVGQFGGSVLVGTEGNNERAAAYLFAKADGHWHPTARLADPDAPRIDRFSNALALAPSGRVALVGSTYATGGGDVDAYQESGSTWRRVQMLHGDDSQTGWEFGAAIAISADGQHALIGSPQRGRSRDGAMYLFDRSASRVRTFTAPG